MLWALACHFQTLQALKATRRRCICCWAIDVYGNMQEANGLNSATKADTDQAQMVHTFCIQQKLTAILYVIVELAFLSNTDRNGPKADLKG